MPRAVTVRLRNHQKVRPHFELLDLPNMKWRAYLVVRGRLVGQGKTMLEAALDLQRALDCVYEMLAEYGKAPEPD